MFSALPWWKKLLLGCLIAATLASATIIALEVGLRVAGYGHDAKFWRTETDAEGKTWIRENWWVTAPFFSTELVRRPQAFRLPQVKAEDTYRIFVLGSSAAMGDPEPSFSIARVLEVMLRDAYPTINFEVVNAGITAINSHVVRRIAEDCAELQPDMFVVYEGNNEVIGPFGPATVFTAPLRNPRAIDASIAFRRLRLGQWVSAAAQKRTRGSELKDWGGMEMFLRHQIRADDPRLVSTAELFEGNLRSIVKSGRAAGARVVLATVLTNQQDFAPFRSGNSAALAPPEKTRFDEHLRTALTLAKRGEWIQAEAELKAALAIDTGYAEAHFILGRMLMRRDQKASAKAAFMHALDLDLLRFRTDSRLNEVIKRVAKDPETGAVLADVVQAGEAESSHGILGDELLYEHVHLNFRGTYVAAREMFSQVTSDLKRRTRLPAEGAEIRPLSMDLARQRLAFNIYEQAMITRELIARLSRPPFDQQSTNVERLSLLRQRDARASQLLSGAETEGVMKAVYEQAIAANPNDWILRRNYGMAVTALGQPAAGKAALQEALKTIGDDPDTLYGLIVANQALGETAEAERWTAALQKLAPKYLETATAK